MCAQFGRTALCIAVKAGKVEAVRVLLDHGAKIDVVDSVRLSTLTFMHMYHAFPFVPNLRSNVSMFHH